MFQHFIHRHTVFRTLFPHYSGALKCRTQLEKVAVGLALYYVQKIIQAYTAFQ